MQGHQGHVVISLGYAAQRFVCGTMAVRHTLQSWDHWLSNWSPMSSGRHGLSAEASLDTQGAYEPVASV